MSSPIIKWGTSRKGLAPFLYYFLPPTFDRYYEPFFTDGAVFCNIEPKPAVIKLINPLLADMYRQVKENPLELCGALHTIQASYNSLQTMIEKDKFYYTLRDQFYKQPNAASFIFLNQAGINGLTGSFDVSSARRKTVNVYDRENILAFSKLLRTTEITCDDYEATENDFILLDPPNPGMVHEFFTTTTVPCMLLFKTNALVKKLYKDFPFVRTFCSNRLTMPTTVVTNYHVKEQSV